jgi:oligoribonuclease (3'-5' exoribonuclease)
VDDQVFNLAYYLQELTIIESHMKEWTPSKIAAASIFFAKKMLRREVPWCPQMMQHTGYTTKQVRECARDICIILNKTTKKKQNKLYKAIIEKFKTKKYLGVAYIPARMRQEAL